jgi:5-methylcytosine-specific restriction endonuclease McrA
MPRSSGKSRLLQYLIDHLGDTTHNQTLRDASGLDDVARSLRELRQEGWDITVVGDGNIRLESDTQGQARGRRGPISEKTRYQVLQAGSFRCRACGRGPTDGVKLVVDHVVPVDWGGSSDLSNLQSLCEQCNHGKQAWVSDLPGDAMRVVFEQPSVERRIEALFDALPNQDVPSLLIQLASRNALDWQRALRRIRQRTGKQIEPTNDRRSYRYTPTNDSPSDGP